MGCGTSAVDDGPAGGARDQAPPSAPPSSSGGEQRGKPDRTDRPAADVVPVAVRLPALDLDEDLVDLGLTDSGALEVPEDPDRVGWFTGGGRPGGTGPTVVVGHVDSTTGPAVFAELPALAVGDVAVVELSDGSAVRYRVERVRDVPQNPFPTEEVFGATPEDTLRLITCTGPYDSAAGRYTENRVVDAVALD